ncbi:hypothetical protein BR93DRAFT_924289 [Coniochaeta sp. PMI_546]|nr:hypothetical protein BR93DRAFT_924289 [Coniochaeta sp. PMI_546]
MRPFSLMTVHIHVFHILLLATISIASKIPKAPGLSYLYTVNITGGPTTTFGPGPRGTRLAVPILGGKFSGPKLKGTVLPLGGDWPLIDANNPNGTITLDVRQTFATDDGAFIQVFETGSSQPDGTAHVRLTFETGSQKYYWINSVVGVGILRLGSSGEITIDAFQLTSPSI